MLLLVFSPNFPLISLLLGHRQVTIENSMLNFHVSLYQAKKWQKQPWKRVNCFQIKIKCCIESSFASTMRQSRKLD